MNVGMQIRMRRMMMGMNQSELASRVGTAQVTISRIERGAFANPSQGLIDAIAAQLNIGLAVTKMDDLVEIKGDSREARRLRFLINVYCELSPGGRRRAFRDVLAIAATEQADEMLADLGCLM